MKYVRWLLFPFSLLYGLVMIIRNFCYDAGIFKSYKFNKPIISVGNLDVGGAGKSPMTEYLIRLLKNDYKVATLSRGYGRSTKGYLSGSVERGAWSVEEESSKLRIDNQDSRARKKESGAKNKEPRDEARNITLATDHSPLAIDHSQQATGNKQQATDQSQLTAAQLIGDEPAQFQQKFPDITVAVCEDRVAGLKKLLPDHDVVILDDAYQHRAVEPGLSILLFNYNRVKDAHFLLPAGNLREPFSGRWRAHIIVITKCPAHLSGDEQSALAAMIGPLPYQRVFFCSTIYGDLQDISGKRSAIRVEPENTVFLLTGIANANPLYNYLKGKGPFVIHHKYPDHHPFTLRNITKLADEFKACSSSKKIIITTEKDAQRLNEPVLQAILQPLPVFVMPIKVQFLNQSEIQFNQLVVNYVRKYTAGHALS